MEELFDIERARKQLLILNAQRALICEELDALQERIIAINKEREELSNKIILTEVSEKIRNDVKYRGFFIGKYYLMKNTLLPVHIIDVFIDTDDDIIFMANTYSGQTVIMKLEQFYLHCKQISKEEYMRLAQ